MDFQQQQHGYLRPPPPAQPLPPSMSMPGDLYHQRFPLPPPPNPWYSTQFQYQHSSSPSPPPPPPPPQHHVPPQHQQWTPAPAHSDHYAQPPPPPATANYPAAPSPYGAAHHPAPHNHYPPPPPPHSHPHQLPPLPPRPPHVPPPQMPQSYPQVNQDWGNANWSHHQGWEYQANTNEEVWAAKARAWAAAKVASDSQQIQHLQYPTKEGSLPADSTAAYHGKDSSISPSVHHQEDEVEAARVAAINQEIKRVLTVVLLKVTDELFDELATKVLNEDNGTPEVDRIAATSDRKATTSSTSAKVLVPVRARENDSSSASQNSASSPPVNVLGLANYASEDDEDSEIQSSERYLKKNTVQRQSASNKFLKGMDVVGNGNSQEETRENLDDHVKMESGPSISTLNVSAVNDSALVTELDKERASRDQGSKSSFKMYGATENVSRAGINDAKEKAEKPVENVVSQKSVEDDSLGQETRNTSNKNDSRKEERNFGGKEQKTKELDIDRSNKRGNESHSRHIERRKKERKIDHNGTKERVKEKGIKSAEKAKDSDSRKRSSPDYVREERKERQTDRRATDKEDRGRKRERTRDDKREKIRHTNASESSRHKRHRSSCVSSRARENKDGSGGSDSSNESSYNSRRRLHSRRDKSPSATRSKKRLVLVEVGRAHL